MGGLAYALRTLPIGTGYAVWVGVGASLTVLYGMASGAESVSDAGQVRIRSTVASVRTVLMGDSHLARLRRELHTFSGDVRNAAEGGATSRDLRRQADAAGLHHSDVAVLSVGTNDAAPWKQVPVSEFVQSLSMFVASHSPRGWVVVAPPGVVEGRLTGARARTNALIAEYRLAAIEVCEEVGGHAVRTDLMLESLGAQAFAPDGLHLNGAGYRVLVPAIKSACAALH